MSELSQLKPLLVRLKLTGISEILEPTINQAMAEKWSYSQLLLHLFSREASRRENKQNYYRIARSGLDVTKSLEVFNFEFNKNISQHVIKELAQCHYIDNHENVFFVGPSGVGKSHLANALGLEACHRGYEVLFHRLTNLLEWLHSGHGDASFDKRMKTIIKIPLLIIDDFGLIPLNNRYQIYLYEIISNRYEKGSIIITSNRDFSEWIEIFDNPLMGSAAMDRLVHKAIKIAIEGESYRTYYFKMQQKKIFNIEND